MKYILYTSYFKSTKLFNINKNKLKITINICIDWYYENNVKLLFNLSLTYRNDLIHVRVHNRIKCTKYTIKIPVYLPIQFFLLVAIICE